MKRIRALLYSAILVLVCVGVLSWRHKPTVAMDTGRNIPAVHGAGSAAASASRLALKGKKSADPLVDPASSLKAALELLKIRKDSLALNIFEDLLISQPDNSDALWGKAEVLRRSRDYTKASEILTRILKQNDNHIPSLLSYAYISFKEDKINQALDIIGRVLKMKNADKENQALAYSLLGAINSRRSQGWAYNKLVYGTKIRSYFSKALELAPSLAESHLGMGTFYLLAPSFAGGDVDKAIDELQLCVKIAPDFATANARLAQAYEKKGFTDKSGYYMDRARSLDPDNELLGQTFK